MGGMGKIAPPKHLAYINALPTRPRFNLSDSCGPSLALGEFFQLVGCDGGALAATKLSYNPLNGTEQLRSSLSVNAQSVRTGLELQTSTSVEVSFTLIEAITESSLAEKRVTLVSQEGLGNITLEKTDADGNLTFDIYPGLWS